MVTYGGLFSILFFVWNCWARLQIRSFKWSHCVFTKKMSWSLAVFACMTETATGKLCSIPRSHHHISCGQAPVSFRKKTKGYMAGMSTLLSLLLLQWAQFLLPFEMLNQNVFNFGDSLSRYLGATQAWPATAWERSSDFNSAGPPSGPCGH